MSKHRTLLAVVAAASALVVGGLMGLAQVAVPAAPPAPPTRPTQDFSLRRTPVVEAVRRVREAVVNIHSERTALGPATEELFALAPTQNRINGMGTGIVIDPRGYIVTNYHVIEDVQLIRIRLADGTAGSARVVARDQESDLALLKVDAGRPLPVMPLGTASDLMVGETVIAIGNAYGYEHTVSTGIVSAVGRDVVLNKEVSYKALIQTDAAINPGNSGGPLLNVYGELVGVNVAIRAGAQGIGFAIPVDTMIHAAAQMLAVRGVRSGVASHGLTLRDDVRKATDTAPFQRSVVVDRVEPGTAAAKAGLQRGDVVTMVGDVSVGSSLDVERGMLDRGVGDHVQMVVHRSSGDVGAELVLEAAKVVPVTGDVVWRKLGLKVQNVPADSITRTQPQLHGGVLVTDVRPEGGAARAGLQRGDILVGLHQWEMLTLDNVVFVANHPDLATFNPVRFYILRAGQVHRGFLQSD